MFSEIGILISGMTIQSTICIALGFIFILIEIFQPGFGIFGAIGCILSIVGIVLRVIVGDGNILAQIFILIFFQSIMTVTAFIIMIIVSKKGWLNRTELIEIRTAAVKDYTETSNYLPLMGKDGIAITDLKPVGKANINGVVYDVIAEGFYIKKGETVRAINIDKDKISVDRAD